MKWSDEKVMKLKEMCYKEFSNKDIAAVFGIDIRDVYAKRSQLGITIDKCKEQKIDTEVDTAFRTLLKALMKEVEQESPGTEKTRKIKEISDALIDLNAKCKKEA